MRHPLLLALSDYLFMCRGESHPSNGAFLTSMWMSYRPSLNMSPTHLATWGIENTESLHYLSIIIHEAAKQAVHYNDKMFVWEVLHYNLNYYAKIRKKPFMIRTISVIMMGSPYSISLVDSMRMTVRLMVMRTTPPRNEAAPINEYVPAYRELVRKPK